MMTDPPAGHVRRNTSNDLQVIVVGDRQIVMTRRFAAPRSLVFDALITPELLLRWMHGPEGWRMIRCEVDATEGGRYRYVWRGPQGERMTAETADDNTTVLTNTATYTSRAARDAALRSGMERGVGASYAHLDRLLADHPQIVRT